MDVVLLVVWWFTALVLLAVALERAYWRRRALHAEEAGADLMAQIAAGLREGE